jgi:TatD DNase family protein
MMKLTDTHCHLDLGKFDADRDDVIRRALAAGLTRILIPGITLKSSRAIVKLAESQPNLFAAVGVHPNDSNTWDAQTIPALRELAVSLKVVAIGEIGLDYYWEAAPREHQHKVLEEQLNLAAEQQLPVIIHIREKDDAPDGDCAQDTLKILEQWVQQLRVDKNPLAEQPGVIHSFSGTRQTAEKAIALNFYLGVTGPVTYKNAESRQEVVAALPLERLLIETDAPYLAPQPKRGQRNEPAYVLFMAEKIALLHSLSLDQVAETTTANAARLFAWGG